MKTRRNNKMDTLFIIGTIPVGVSKTLISSINRGCMLASIIIVSALLLTAGYAIYSRNKSYKEFQLDLAA